MGIGVTLLVVIVGFVAFQMGKGNSGSSTATTQVAQNDTSATDSSASSSNETSATSSSSGETDTSSTGDETDTDNTSSSSSTPDNISLAQMNNETGSGVSTSENSTSTEITTTEGNTETGDQTTDIDATPSEPLKLTELIKLVEPSVIRIYNKGEYTSSHGSGFIVNKEGLAVTNYHVIEGAKTIEAELRDGTRVEVEGFYKADRSLDIAIIKLKKQDKPFRISRLVKSVPEKGESVAAFGAPYGLSYTASEGIVSGIRSSKDLPINKGEEDAKDGTWVQTTAPISPGNSGGPLVNMKGEVVAMNTMGFTVGQNLNLSISIKDIREMLDSRGETVAKITPKSVPSKNRYGIPYQEIVGTQKAKVLLSQMREVAVFMLPFHLDPSGKIILRCILHAERAIEDKAKLKKLRALDYSKISEGTPMMIITMHFRDSEKGTLFTSELYVQMAIMVRDVDKNGNETIYLVYEKKGSVGNVSLESLALGVVPRTTDKGIQDFFGDFSTTVRRAVRDVEKGL